MNFTKSFIVSVAILLFSALSAFAQNYQEVVYLKNGSVIKGVITEEIPNQSVTIKTSDGSVIICKMEDVSKITKEVPENKTSLKKTTEKGIVQSSDRYANHGWNLAPRYRGMLGESLIVGTGDFDESAVSFYTSHGCQITPYVYAGLGVGLTAWSEYGVFDAISDPDCASVPIFAHCITELHKLFNKRVSPFFEMKMGYSLGEDISGFYCAPAVGCHVYFGKTKMGLGASIGYNVQCVDVEYGDFSGLDEALKGVSFSLVFDF